MNSRPIHDEVCCELRLEGSLENMLLKLFDVDGVTPT